MTTRFSARESPTLKKYRELLGVTSGASASELKKAYHQMAFLYHPDRNSEPWAVLHFQKIKEAYEVLSDPTHAENLRREHFKEKLFDVCLDGLKISFGAFFGYRVFLSDHEESSRSTSDKSMEVSVPGEKIYIEEDRSILDDAAFDSIEVVYAGRFASSEEADLLTQGRKLDHQNLPWVLLNNQGILEFLDENYDKSLKCYKQLNQRIQNNIIFMYREALCHLLLAFQNPERTFLGKSRPKKSEIQIAVQLLKKCIFIGNTRPVGRQHCWVIRKLLADTLEKLGHTRSARKLWEDIYKQQPKSIEAALKSGHPEVAETLLRKKQNRIAPTAVHRALLKGRMSS